MGHLMESGFVPIIDFSRHKIQILIVESIRIGSLFIVLIGIFALQMMQPEFINFELLFSVCSVLSAIFFIHLLYIFYFESARLKRRILPFLFIFDIISITSLTLLSGVNQSTFLLLYIINIILCGFIFQRRGAVLLALLTSFLFSGSLIFGPLLNEQTIYLSYGVNNLAFFAVAGLSGYLSEQLNFMGSELQARGKDIKALKNFNAIVIENMATGMLTIDSQGEILQLNRAGGGIIDEEPDSLIGQPIDKVLQGILKSIQEQNFTKSGKNVGYIDFELKSVFGKKKILSIIVSPLREESTVLTGYILTFQDLTKVRRLEEFMRQSEKLAAVGQLAAGIAHEIRNPLASISGSIQMLDSMLGSQHGDQKKLMQITMREIDRLNNMITEFLTFVRPDNADLQKMSLSLLISDVLEMVKVNGQLRQGIVYESEISLEIEILGDRDKLKQALLNIVINACQAMETVDQPKLVVCLVKAGDNCSLRIHDNGIGMDKRTLKRIFEPFLTTKPKGTGLGLAVTHKILEIHDARVFVDSTVDVGTEFVLEFPLLHEKMSDNGEDLTKNDTNSSKLLAEAGSASDDISLKVKG